MGYGDLRKGRCSAPGYEYLVTTVCAGRRRVFADDHADRRLIECVQSLETEGHARWLAWVVMPDHFHGLVSLPDAASLSRLMRMLKGRSSRALGGPVWQKGFHDHALRLEEQRDAVARYVVGNPVRAGIVDHIDDYPYWYCAWAVTAGCDAS